MVTPDTPDAPKLLVSLVNFLENSIVKFNFGTLKLNFRLLKTNFRNVKFNYRNVKFNYRNVKFNSSLG